MFKWLINTVIVGIGKIHWPTNTMLSLDDQAKIRELLVNDYFVILTYRKNHLSTFFVGLANFFLSGRWSRWSHALMNLEDSVKFDTDFRLVAINEPVTLTARNRTLIEATGEGSHVTPFDKVFDCHAAALLKPKSMTLEEWRALVDTARAQMGKPYDTLFNIADDSALSCVELVRVILQAHPNYERDFANFEALIKKRKNLSPQMFIDCGDFDVVFEARV